MEVISPVQRSAALNRGMFFGESHTNDFGRQMGTHDCYSAALMEALATCTWKEPISWEDENQSEGIEEEMSPRG